MNETFLAALFGSEAWRVHVTGFMDDPGAIPADRHRLCWAGGRFSERKLPEKGNQYFTISLFKPDHEGRSRRRKALFECTPVIVLDDVKEKLPLDRVELLPKPTWVLETSAGSEQWGYLLDTPCRAQSQVDNLLDGLVERGLSPTGTDPGMKGVTRYVRLPDGYNTKASRQMFGLPWKCDLKVWEPERRVTMAELAKTFDIDLHARRRESRVDGAADVPDHPLLQLLNIKEVRSDGRYDITCPWVHEHTGEADDGAGVFTNADNSIGFKCHHGSCQERTGVDLLNWAEAQEPGFRARLVGWKAFSVMPDFIGSASIPTPPSGIVPPEVAPAGVGLQPLLDLVRKLRPTSPEAKEAAKELLKLAEELPAIEQIEWHDGVRDAMSWNKTDFNRVLRDLRKEWGRGMPTTESDFYDNLLFVIEMNQFYNWKTRGFLSVEGFTNAYLHLDEQVRKRALQDELVKKVDRLDYAPGKPRVFAEGNLVMGNMYYGDEHPVGEPGDCSVWLNHWEAMGWAGSVREHMLQFMAYTILHPERKINHMMILGSREGSGKDFLLYPLIKAMGEDGKVIDGDALEEGYTGYLNGVKYLHINETELGNRNEALKIANKLKPIAAAPPEKLRINEKYVAPFHIRNLVNGTMTTNSRMPLRLQQSRRFYAVWSELNIRGENGQVKPEWTSYWEQAWGWMIGGGWKQCIYHLRNYVDLSDFKPGVPPPVTDFLRDIQESSKPPVQRTIEAFIEHRIGVFDNDMITTTEAMQTLKAGEIAAPDLMFADYRLFTAGSVTSALKDIGAYMVRGQAGGEAVRAWVIRGHDRYQKMSKKDIAAAYLNARSDYAAQNPIKLVPRGG